jgi:hypothetical protein
MSGPSQPLPSEESPSGTIARRVLSAAGTAFPAPDGSHTAAEFLAFGDAIADEYDALSTAMDQCFADSATVMLNELEATYGLTVRTDLLNTERQARLTAKIRAARAAVPLDIASAISAYDPTVTIHENIATDPDLGDPRGVFVWAAQVSVATFNDPLKLATIRAVIEQIKPAETLGSVCTRVGFRCDDPDSLVERDVL